ncbi:HAD-IA family hydrolase [Micrococcus luteus]|uniref:HAD-IA family hydrolase n=1 Tax=Micrococcus luteus TaxID=1270 RepID=UPI003406C610
MTHLECSALLFDLDDTLVLSTPSIEAAWCGFAKRHGLDFDKVRTLLPGRRGRDILAAVMPRMTDAQAANELDIIRQSEIAASETIMPVPGAEALTHMLPKNRWAVVTAAPRMVMEARLRGAGLPTPAVTICAEDVVDGKPSPEGFLAAAGGLEFDPRHCLGFEDSTAGFQALTEAGIKTVAIARHMTVYEGTVVCSIRDYEDVTIEVAGDRIRIEIP